MVVASNAGPCCLAKLLRTQTMAKVATRTLLRVLSYYVTFQLYELISKPWLQYYHHLETCPVS